MFCFTESGFEHETSRIVPPIKIAKVKTEEPPDAINVSFDQYGANVRTDLDPMASSEAHQYHAMETYKSVIDVDDPRPRSAVQIKVQHSLYDAMETADSTYQRIDYHMGRSANSADNLGNTDSYDKLASQTKGYSLIPNEVDDKYTRTCPFCGKSFSQHSHMKRHLVTTHSTRKHLQCPTCGKCFNRTDSLQRHRLTKKCIWKK